MLCTISAISTRSTIRISVVSNVGDIRITSIVRISHVIRVGCVLVSVVLFVRLVC